MAVTSSSVKALYSKISTNKRNIKPIKPTKPTKKKSQITKLEKN